jgi:hypothetical protein
MEVERESSLSKSEISIQQKPSNAKKQNSSRINSKRMNYPAASGGVLTHRD